MEMESESQFEGINAPSFKSPVVDKERMWGQATVLWLALTLLVGWQDGNPASNKTCATYLWRFLP